MQSICCLQVQALRTLVRVTSQPVHFPYPCCPAMGMVCSLHTHSHTQNQLGLETAGWVLVLSKLIGSRSSVMFSVMNILPKCLSPIVLVLFSILIAFVYCEMFRIRVSSPVVTDPDHRSHSEISRGTRYVQGALRQLTGGRQSKSRYLTHSTIQQNGQGRFKRI